MDEVVVEGKRYKIYVSNSKLESEIRQSPPDGLIFEPVSTIDEADIVVLVEDESDLALFQNSQEHLARHPRKKEVIAIFLAKEANINNFDEQEFLHFEEWRKEVGLEIATLVNSSEKDRKKEFEEALVFLMAGSPQKSAASFSREEPSKVVGSPVVPAPAAAPAPAVVAPKAMFFKYPFPTKTLCHSRQLRRDYAEDKLRLRLDDPSHNEVSEVQEQKERIKLISLFTHYMSIRHVNSWLSKKFEKRLAKKLMSDADYLDYKSLRNKKRAFIRGKKYDSIAHQLEALLLKKISTPETLGDIKCKLNFQIDLLRSVDYLERGFVHTESRKKQIKHTLNVAERTAQHLFSFSREQQKFDQKWRANIAYSAENAELDLPRRAKRCLDRWVARKGLSY